MLKSTAIPRFGGLNVIADPLELGSAGAVDLLNVDFDALGRVRTRDGWALLGTDASTLSPSAMAYYKIEGYSDEFIVTTTDGNFTTAYRLGTLTTFATAPGISHGVNNGFARFGDTNDALLYIAAGDMLKFDGVAFTSLGASPTSDLGLLAITPSDNRLVAASYLDQGGTVWFSDAGGPESWQPDNFVQLHPGDGEALTALIAWRDYIFAFKGSQFFVFYGTSTDRDGEPIFNYRAVNFGRGCASAGGAVAGEEGVYFADQSGIYLTTGAAPRYLSRAIEPWLKATTFGSLPTMSLRGALTLVYHERRLYVTDTTNRTTLVYDPALDSWTVWQAGVTGMVSIPLSSAFSGLYFGQSTQKKIAKFTGTTDNGSAIAWSYTSGDYDLGSPAEKKIRYTDLYGTGTVNVQLRTRGGRAADIADPGGAVTLGAAPTIARGRRARSARARLFSHKLSGSGAASVSTLEHWHHPPGSAA